MSAGELLAEVARLRAVIDEVRRIAEAAAGDSWRSLESKSVLEAEGRNAVGASILRLLDQTAAQQGSDTGGQQVT